MNEWEDPIFEEVAEKMENEQKEKLNCGKHGFVEADRINTLKSLRPFLCTLAVPHGHKGIPKSSACKTCKSQCAYGRRLIELIQINMQLAAKAKAEKRGAQKDDTDVADIGPAATAPEESNLCAVYLTKSQCQNVADFIEVHLIDAIRNDVDIDNIAWVKDMILAMEVLKKCGGGTTREG